MISKELIIELRDIVKEVHDEEKSLEEVRLMAADIVKYFDSLIEASYQASIDQKE